MSGRKPSYATSALAEDGGVVRLRDAAHAAVERDLGAVDLARTGLSPQLLDQLDQREQRAAGCVRARQVAAVRVGGQPPAERDAALVDERSAIALLAEAGVL